MRELLSFGIIAIIVIVNLGCLEDNTALPNTTTPNTTTPNTTTPNTTTPNTTTPNDLNFIGFALSQQGKYDEALRTFDKAIEIDPQNADAWYLKGMVLDDMGKHDEATQAYDEAIRIDPSKSTEGAKIDLLSLS